MFIFKNKIMETSVDKNKITSKNALANGLITEDSKNMLKHKTIERAKCGHIKQGAGVLIPLWTQSKGRCLYCNKKLSPEKFTIDHIIPISKGGLTTFNNLAICCEICNAIKADKTPEVFRAELKALNNNLNRKYKKK